MLLLSPVLFGPFDIVCSRLVSLRFGPFDIVCIRLGYFWLGSFHIVWFCLSSFRVTLFAFTVCIRFVSVLFVSHHLHSFRFAPFHIICSRFVSVRFT